LLQGWKMVGERFDSGGVLERARPVLTFATNATNATGRAPAAGPASATPDTIELSWSGPETLRRNDLPVIPRIVRRTTLEHLLEPFEHIASVAWRSAGLLLFGALGLGTLGIIAGLGWRSLPDETSSTFASTRPSRAFDAVATERLLARAPAAMRGDRTIPPPPPRAIPGMAPAVAPTTRPALPGAHANFAAARAPKKQRASVVAHR